jgi:hypothetical protein
MVSFDAVSFYTRVTIKATMVVLGHHFEEDVLGLFRHVLTLPISHSRGKLMV